MSEVLIIQNTRLEGSGVLGELFANDGFKIRPVFAKKEKISQNDSSLLVVLGGPQSANDNLSYRKFGRTILT